MQIINKQNMGKKKRIKDLDCRMDFLESRMNVFLASANVDEEESCGIGWNSYSDTVPDCCASLPFFFTEALKQHVSKDSILLDIRHKCTEISNAIEDGCKTYAFESKVKELGQLRDKLELLNNKAL